jgi:hypothetical protein
LSRYCGFGARPAEIFGYTNRKSILAEVQRCTVGKLDCIVKGLSRAAARPAGAANTIET